MKPPQEDGLNARKADGVCAAQPWPLGLRQTTSPHEDEHYLCQNETIGISNQAEVATVS
jgi:hypothetical protein